MPAGKKKNFIFCVHAHQPVGNFGSVFEEAYERSYRPFFEVVSAHPAVKVSAHFSGSLLDWLAEHHPEFISKLKSMAQSGQIEFLGGAYYEAIYGMIPAKDLKGQILKMRAKLREFFGVEFEGVWLTERVWDAQLPALLKSAKVNFTILDDLHFENSGVQAPVTGFYKAGTGKNSLDLFASMKDLRYLMPFQKAEKTLEFFHAATAQENDVWVFADDCEKFGMWPGTYDWVYGQKWLDQFFTLIENDEQIQMCHFSEVRKSCKSKGTLSIKHASYTEMMEWSGGRFYNFFEKYAESGYMRDRMESVSRRAQRSKEALNFLYKAQCNCSYWHGVFGGLYLHHLRSAVFENLIAADKILEKKPLASKEKLGAETHYKIRQNEIVSYLNAGLGGALEEIDYLPKTVNLMCNLMRRKEIYHEVAHSKKAKEGSDEPLSIHDMLGSKEKDLDKHLFYDPYRRFSFLDHFFGSTISNEEFLRASYIETGDFAGKPFRAKQVRVTGRSGWVLERKAGALLVQKTFLPLKANTLEVRYRIKNVSKKTFSAVWGTEFNFSIGDPYANQGVRVEGVREWVFKDSWRNLEISLTTDRESTFLTAPIETVSESESGLERTFQELGALVQVPLRLEPGALHEQIFKLAIN